MDYSELMIKFINVVTKLPFSKMVWAAWNGTRANISVPENIIHVFSFESWFPQVAQTSLTKGLESSISFITNSKGEGTLDVVVRARFLNAVNASLFPFLILSFSTNYHHIIISL